MASSSFPHELLAGLVGQCCLTLPTPSEAVGTCQLVLPAWSTHLWQFCNYSSLKAVCAGTGIDTSNLLTRMNLSCILSLLPFPNLLTWSVEK